MKKYIFMVLSLILAGGALRAQVVITQPGVTEATIDTNSLAIVDGKLTVVGGGAGASAWGTITGSLANQADVWAALTNRYTIAEIQAQGYASTGSVAAVEASIPTNNNQLANGAGYVTTDDIQSAFINDGSRFYSQWSGPTNSLYIVSPDGLYTNLLMTTF